MPFRIEKVERKPMTPPKSEIFFLAPPEFVGRFQERQDIPMDGDLRLDADGNIATVDGREHLKQQLLLLLATSGSKSKWHSEYDCAFQPLELELSIPRFDLERYGRRVLVHWRDKVPNVLTDLLSPLLGACRGHLEAYGPIRARLRMMAAFGELLWNQEKKRFELHFSE